MSVNGTKKRIVYGIVLTVGIVIGLLGMNLWQSQIGGEKVNLINVLISDDAYYKKLQEEFANQKGKNKEIISELKRYEERTMTYTYYSEEEELYYVTLEIYFTDVEQLHDKNELFCVLDERFYWTTEKADIGVWGFDGDDYTRKYDLGFIGGGTRGAVIDIHELKKEKFPLHIQIKFTGTWAEEEIPEKITFEYGVW